MEINREIKNITSAFVLEDNLTDMQQDIRRILQITLRIIKDISDVVD